MTPENDRITPEKAMELLGIKKSQYYARVKKLDLKLKRENGKAYLSEEQMQLLRSIGEESSNLAVAEEVGTISLENLPEMAEPEGDELDDIMRSAQELKAQQLVMPDLVKIYLASGMSESDLPLDLQEKIRAAREAANPKKSFQSIGNRILEQYRSRQK
jgi:hypothetical protein